MLRKSIASLFSMLLVVGGACAVASASTGTPGSVKTAGIWYEDNNMAVAGGSPADFYSKFLEPDTWANARKVIDVYYVRANVLEAGADDNFLQKYFIPVLAKSHVELALDVGSATFLNSDYAGNIGAAYNDVALIRRIEALGGHVDYIGLQSTLSKPLVVDGQKVDYPMATRIKDAVDYATLIKENFPDIKMGLIDALPTKGLDYQGPYQDLVDAFTDAGLSLDFIHLDNQYQLAQAGVTTSWAKIKQVEAYVKDTLHVHFGLVATDRAAGYTSDEAYHDAVLDVPVQYQKAGGSPDEYVIMSWYPHPALTVPEFAPDGQYPAMKTVLDFYAELAGCGWHPAAPDMSGTRDCRGTGPFSAAAG